MSAISVLTSVNYSLHKDPNVPNNQHIEEEALKATEQRTDDLDMSTKQKTLFDMLETFKVNSMN